jgi:hypothetical protein
MHCGIDVVDLASEKKVSRRDRGDVVVGLTEIPT